MARMGIDFGTTNTVVVVHDRGLFNVVGHEVNTAAGLVMREVFPSSIVVEKDADRRWFGPEAERRLGLPGAGRGQTPIRSLKRQLRDYAEGRRVSAPEAAEAGICLPPIDELLTGFLAALRDSIRRSQALNESEPLETVITWPANANGAQRHVTRHCFREAGFIVKGAMNEPTASAVELAESRSAGSASGQAAPTAVAVFDLGGGTFDASVVRLDGRDCHVLASGGIESLGGDDFDDVLFEMFLKKLKLPSDAPIPLLRQALLRHARDQKETIAGSSARSLMLNPDDFGLDWPVAVVSVRAFEKRIAPMLEPAVAMLRGVVASATARDAAVDPERPGALSICLVGGSSRLPLVARMVAEAFPAVRCVLTDKPFRSVAMGAAIRAVDRVNVREVFARHFGLLRPRDHGRAEMFDTIFPAGTPLPAPGEPPLERTTEYAPTHNIGHLHYLECAAVDAKGMPADGVRPWSDVLFPYDPQLSMSQPLSADQVVATDSFAADRVSEVYRCDCDGVISVELRRPSRGESRCYEICRD